MPLAQQAAGELKWAVPLHSHAGRTARASPHDTSIKRTYRMASQSISDTGISVVYQPSHGDPIVE